MRGVFLDDKDATSSLPLVGGFNKINSSVMWVSPSGCRVMKEKHPFSVLTHLVSVCEPIKTATKNQQCSSFFDIKVAVSLKKKKKKESF